MFNTTELNKSAIPTNLSVLEPSSDDFLYYLQLGFCSALAPPTIIENSLVIVSLLKDRKSSVTTGFNTFAIALALTDLLVGAMVLPVRAHEALLIPFGRVGCAIWKTIDLGLTSVSIFLMVAMGADRSSCVTSPLVYRMKFTRKRAVLISVLLWILGFAVWIPIILVTFVKYGSIGIDNTCTLTNLGILVIPQTVLTYCIPILAMVVVNIRLVLAVRKRCVYHLSENSCLSYQVNGDRKGINKRSDTDITRDKKDVKSGSHSVDKKRTISYQNRQCIKISVLIVLTFLVSWTPFAVVYPIRILNENLIPVAVILPFSYLVYVNSAITPIVYIFTSRKVRRGIKGIIPRRKSPPQRAVVFLTEK